MEQRGIFRCRCPLQVTTRVSSHRSACHLSANTSTSVSGETMSILVAPDIVASTACSSSFMSASSWLLSRYCMSLCIHLHLLSHTTVTHEPSSGPSSSILMARYSVSSFLVLTCARSLFIGTYKIRSSLQSVNLKSKTGIQYKEFSLNILLPCRSVYCL